MASSVAVVSLVPRFAFLAAAARRSLSSCAAVHFLHVSDEPVLRWRSSAFQIMINETYVGVREYEHVNKFSVHCHVEFRNCTWTRIS